MADKQEMNTATANLPTTMQTQSTAAKNKANEAQLRYNANKSPENTQAYLKALLESYSLEMQNNTFEANLEGLRILSKLTAELTKAKSDKGVNLSSTAAEKDLTLQLELTQDQRKELDHELKTIYDKGLASQDSTINLLGMARGFAVLLSAFGVDCKDFIQRCDDGIKSSLASVPHIQMNRLNEINKIINLDRPMEQLNHGFNTTISEINPKNTATVAQKINSINPEELYHPTESTKPAAPATTPEPKGAKLSVDTAKAISAAHADGQGIKLQHPDKLDDAIKAAAAKDGDAATLTKTELFDLNARLIGLEGKDNAAEILRRIQNEAKAGVGPSNSTAAKLNLPVPAPS